MIIFLLELNLIEIARRNQDTWETGIFRSGSLEASLAARAICPVRCVEHHGRVIRRHARERVGTNLGYDSRS